MRLRAIERQRVEHKAVTSVDNDTTRPFVHKKEKRAMQVFNAPMGRVKNLPTGSWGQPKVTEQRYTQHYMQKLGLKLRGL